MLNGKWIALEIYTPDNMALRRIIVVGDSAADCIRQIAATGRNPGEFEYRIYKRTG